jgi:cellulose synthase/poly-beta-1,6-N-acetylglucosamine synthase-like glycosyltransferase
MGWAWHILVVVVALGASAIPVAASAPEEPRQYVETSVSAPTRRVIAVSVGKDLQAALDGARPGDVIALAPGAVFRGPFTLRKTAGAGWITVRSGADDANLPPPGTRITPADARSLATIEAPAGEPALRTEPGAHHVRLIALEIRPAPRVYTVNLVMLGAGDETTIKALPHHIVIERCYVHGDPDIGGRRGIALNGHSIAVIDSYISDWKRYGEDTQAVGGWNGPGPFAIANNYLEASGENVMFGGADPSIPGLVPSDIEIRRNTMSKPLAWNINDRSRSEGGRWSVKNLFELKNAQRVIVDGNVFEHNWVDAQAGPSILFTVRNQDGTAPWSIVADVTFRNNIVRDVAAGVNILGRDDEHVSRQLSRIAIVNNLFVRVGGAQWGGAGPVFQILNGAADITIDHNTALGTAHVVAADGDPPHTGFVFTNNIAYHNEYGVFGSDVGVGTRALARYFPGAQFRRNVLIGGPRALYPPDNFFPPSIDAVGFADRARGGYQLAESSPYRAAGTDGTPVGVDVTKLSASQTARAAPRPGTFAAVGGITADVERGTVTGIASAGFWLCVALLAYVYLGYPAAMLLLAERRPARATGRRAPGRVTVILVVHNEAARIERRIENLLALDYPHQLDIIVASDGSTDLTATRARRYAASGVTVIEFAARRGKSAVLGDVVASAAGDFVVFADARQIFDRGAVAALVARFDDPRVGAVSGELMFVPSAGGAVSTGIGCYWRYEKLIRAAESALDSTVGTTGAIYAIRRELFTPIPHDTILDDVLIPLRIVRAGYRVVFEPAARAWDVAADTAEEELTRKVRTIAGTFQLFAREARWLFHPFRNRLIMQTVSHKGLRLLSPLLLVGAFVSNAALVNAPAYGALFTAQLAFYGAALAGYEASRARRRIGLFGVPYVVWLLNWAIVVAFVRFLSGRQSVVWRRSMMTTGSPGREVA